MFFYLLLLRFCMKPCSSRSHIGNETYLVGNAFHFIFQKGAYVFRFICGSFYYKLVVYLKYKP